MDDLSLESFNRGIEYLKSPEYAKQVEERQRSIAGGQMVVKEWLDSGKISLEEASELLLSISINGALLISPRRAKRLGIL